MSPSYCPCLSSIPLPPMQSGVCCTLCWSSLLWCSSSLLWSGVPAAATSEGEPNLRALLGGGAQEAHLTHDTDRSMQWASTKLLRACKPSVYCSLQASGTLKLYYIHTVLLCLPCTYVCTVCIHVCTYVLGPFACHMCRHDMWGHKKCIWFIQSCDDTYVHTLYYCLSSIQHAVIHTVCTCLRLDCPCLSVHDCFTTCTTDHTHVACSSHEFTLSSML